MITMFLIICAVIVLFAMVSAWMDGRKTYAILGIPLLFLIGVMIQTQP